MPEPIIVPPVQSPDDDSPRIAAQGQSFDVHEWSGSGPDYLHVHYADDEAWHILEGTLTFKFADRQVEAPAGTTVFAPAGVPHAYFEAHGPTRYLIIMPPCQPASNIDPPSASNFDPPQALSERSLCRRFGS